MSEDVLVRPEVTVTEQKVLPETIDYCLSVGGEFVKTRDFWRRSLTKLVKSYQWKAAELRGEDISNINILYTGEELPSETIDYVLDKYRKVVSILGYERREIPSLSIIIDPSPVSYANAGAFACPEESMLWIKTGGFNLAHEINHLITAASPCCSSDFLWEGLSGFVEWKAKTSEERVRDSVDDYELVARQFIHDPHVADEIGKEGIDVEFPREELMAAKIFGGLFFHTLVEDFGLTTQQIGKAWKETTFFESVSGWVKSIGLDPKKVELAWMRRIKLPLPDLMVESRRVTPEDFFAYFVRTWRDRLGLA